MTKLTCKIVMIPTEAATNIRKSIINNREYLIYSSDTYNAWANQHLYLVSDREIKEGDLFINIQYFTSTTPKFGIWKRNRTYTPTSNPKKIEATTDQSLNLPLISQSFIEELVSKQGKINEVMINLIDVGREEWMGDDHTGEPYWNEILKVEVNKNNEVIIHPVKESWTREEVETLCRIALSDATLFALPNFRGRVLTTNEWISKNL